MQSVDCSGKNNHHNSVSLELEPDCTPERIFGRWMKARLLSLRLHDGGQRWSIRDAHCNDLHDGIDRSCRSSEQVSVPPSLAQGGAAGAGQVTLDSCFGDCQMLSGGCSPSQALPPTP